MFLQSVSFQKRKEKKKKIYGDVRPLYFLSMSVKILLE